MDARGLCHGAHPTLGVLATTEQAKVIASEAKRASCWRKASVDDQLLYFNFLPVLDACCLWHFVP